MRVFGKSDNIVTIFCLKIFPITMSNHNYLNSVPPKHYQLNVYDNTNTKFRCLWPDIEKPPNSSESRWLLT